MHIAFVGINYWPDETGIAPFTTGRCEFLASRGHQVTVFTGFPYYPSWRIPADYRRCLVSREERNGVAVIRSWLYVPRRVNSVRRIVHEASFTASSLLRALSRSERPRPDLLVVVTPPLALGLAAIVLSRVWKVPFVQHVADLQPDAAVDLGMLHPGQLTNLLYRIERLGYRKAAVVSTLTESMRIRITSKRIPAEKVVLCPDWAKPELFSVPAQGGGLDFRRRLRLDGEFLVVHAGNMGVKQGLDVLLGAAERSRTEKQIKYLMVGDGAVRERLQQRATAAALDNVMFLPLLPDDQFLDLLAASDLSLVTQQKSVADIVFPSKLITLMSSARAVLASVNPGSEIARVLKQADAGMLVAPEEPSHLLDGIVQLREDPRRRAALGRNGRAFAQRFWGREKTLSELESHLMRITSGRLSSRSGSTEKPSQASAC